MLLAKEIALDGLYMAELSEQDQAKYIGWQGAFYNIAKLVATGLLVYLAGVLIDAREAAGATSGEAALHAWTIIMGAAAVLLVVLGLYHRFSLPAGLKAEGTEKKSAGEELKAVIGDFFRKKHIWLYIAFIILYRLGEGFVMKILAGRNLTETLAIVRMLKGSMKGFSDSGKGCKFIVQLPVSTIQE